MNKLFTPSAYNNVLIWLISIICLPISRLLALFKFTPNFITSLSLVLMILSSFFLINGNSLLFMITFICSLFLDFCDGQVARILNKSNKTKFRFDHFTDTIKISIIYITFGILFNDYYSWIFFFVSYTLFFFNTYIQNILNNALKINNKFLKSTKNKFTFFKYLKLNLFIAIYKLLIPIIFTFNSHSLLLILLVLIDINAAYMIFGYFNLIFIFRIYNNSLKLVNFKK